MVFFDMDDTLLDDRKQVPSSAKQAIRELQKLGVEVVIATGRAPAMMYGTIKQLGISSYISCNGSYVVYRGKELYRDNFNHDGLRALVTVAHQEGHPMSFADHERFWVNRAKHPVVKQVIGDLQVEQPTFSPLLENSDAVYHCVVYCTEAEGIYTRAFPQFRTIRWHRNAIDVLPAGGSKAKGMQVLLEKTGIRQQDTIAFGDGLNDVEMLKFAGTGIAMENGCLEAKAAADLITKRVSDNGIEHGLKLVGLLR